MKGKFSTATDKPINSGYALKRLWGYFADYKLMLLSAVFLTCASNLLSLAGPSLTGMAVDAVSRESGVDFPAVFRAVTLMIIFYIISAVFSFLLSVLMINLSRKITVAMREDTFSKLVDLPVGYFDTNKAGDIISRLSYDIDTVNTSLSDDLVQIFASVITVVGAFLMMARISWRLILVFAVTVPLSIFITRFITKMTQPMYRKRSKAAGDLNGYVEEMISGIKTTAAYSNQQAAEDGCDTRNNDAVTAYYRAEYYGAMMGPSIGFINNISLSLISCFGAILYLLGGISIGGISSFVLYSRKFAGPINEFANIFNELQSALAAAERVFQLQDEISETAHDNPTVYALPSGNVTGENICFGYTPEREILHNLSFNAPNGSLIAIVGETGAGKTTLINLLMRFYDVNSGSIKNDGVDIRDISRDTLRRGYAMVLQDTWLFGGTFYENIAYARPDASSEAVIEAAKAAMIHDYISALPNGYDTYLNEDGISISKGQKQLLTIARAMLCRADMLILDEATSNVDTRTEQKISRAMRTLMKDKTCFVIAHRLSTIENADLILVMADGALQEQGTHSELMNKKGVYYEMYMSQYR